MIMNFHSMHLFFSEISIWYNFMMISNDPHEIIRFKKCGKYFLPFHDFLLHVHKVPQGRILFSSPEPKTHKVSL